MINFDVLERFLKLRQRKTIPLNGYKAAASLLPLVFNDKLHILFTKRAAHLKNHPSQFSFPGGHIEHCESPLEAAIREVEEEIGIPPKKIRIIGVLDDVVSVTNFHLIPHVGIIPYQEKYNFDKNEVESVHLVPLKVFKDEPITVPYHWQGRKTLSIVYNYGNISIFGVTAMVTKSFIEILKESGFLDINKEFI